MGDIVACISTDDGDTWGEPVYIFNHNEREGSLQFAYGNAILFKPPGQDILWAYAIRCPMNFKNSEDSQLAAAYSADGGRSWVHVEPAMGYTGPLVVVCGIYAIEENGHPRYLFPAQRNSLRADPTGDRVQLMLSSTNLIEWKLAGHIPQPTTGPKVFLHEASLAAGDAPGEVKAVMRTATYDDERLALDPPRAFSSTSKDGGRTWSPAQQEPDLWNARSKGFYYRMANGTQFYIYSDGPVGARMALRYKTKALNEPWSAEKTFFEAGIKNSYATLIEVAPGEFRAVWDTGTKDRARTMIHFGKFTVK